MQKVQLNPFKNYHPDYPFLWQLANCSTTNDYFCVFFPIVHFGSAISANLQSKKKSSIVAHFQCIKWVCKHFYFFIKEWIPAVYAHFQLLLPLKSTNEEKKSWKIIVGVEMKQAKDQRTTTILPVDTRWKREKGTQIVPKKEIKLDADTIRDRGNVLVNYKTKLYRHKKLLSSLYLEILCLSLFSWLYKKSFDPETHVAAAWWSREG